MYAERLVPIGSGTVSLCPESYPYSNYWNGGGTGSTLDRDVYEISGYWHWSCATDVTGDDGYANDEEDEDADYYTGFNGTSAAAAQISALAGLIYSINDTLTRGDVDSHIKQYTKGSDSATISFQDEDENTKRISAVADFERALDNVE